MILSRNHLNNITILFQSLPAKHRMLLIGSAVLMTILLLIPNRVLVSEPTTGNFEIGKRYQVALPRQKSSDESTVTNNELLKSFSSSDVLAPPAPTKNLLKMPHLQWKKARVRKGDSLAKIFKRYGLSAKVTYQVSNATNLSDDSLVRLNVGDVLQLGFDQQQQLAQLIYPLSPLKTLYIEQIQSGYKAHIDEKVPEFRTAYAQGVIDSNFWNAGRKAKLTDQQIINLANIFGWDIDFAQDIRKGDSFTIIYQQRFVDGEFLDNGNILAAEFTNQNETFTAIRFKDGHYYTPEGDSMRKAFLRAPVNFQYISSNFKKRRFHPIQKRWKAHNGTDYRAKTGTPVVAAGDGRVIASTYNRFNGHYVFIQHGNNIVTKYLHFSKRKVKKGQRVKQGQVIGLVGMTGLAEAPHLHYEFLVNGVHRNPRTVKLPNARPIARKYKQEFNQIAQQRVQELASVSHSLIAMQGDYAD